MTQAPLRRSAAAVVLAVAFALGLPVGAADHGPLPSASPWVEATAVVGENTIASARALGGYANFSAAQAQAALEKLLNLTFPESELVAFFNRTGHDGAAAVRAAGSSGTAVLAAAAATDASAEAFGDLMARVALEKTGLVVDADAPMPVSVRDPAPCVRDVPEALASARPGQDIVVCAGRYAGPWVVRQHFVTLRSEQGPLATSVDGGGGTAIRVEGSGVTVAGFLVEGADGPGAAGVTVGNPDNSVAGDLFGTVLRDNVIRRNTVGVLVWKAPLTLLVHNTIEESTDAADPSGGVGVLVAEEPGLDLDRVVGELAEDSLGTVLLANNLVRNDRHAVKSVAGSPGTPSLPVLAIADFYGQAAGPTLEVGGVCRGLSAPAGDPRCVNGVGPGVVPVAWSPVPL